MRFGRLRTGLLVLTAWVVGMAGTLTVQGTVAQFSDTTENTGNSFTTMATFPCTAPGSVTLYSTADSAVAEAAPTLNLGTDPVNFGIRSSSTGDARSFVTFALPAIPNRCSVTAATLRVYTAAGVTGRTLQVHRVSGGWTETGITWNTQPGAYGGSVGASSVTSGWVSWSVTSMVQAMYSGTNYGFRLRDSVENSATIYDQAMHPRENTNDPQLVVTFG
jgi:hypothetical protein